ncbi:MAG: TonB-dependent receptor [Ferruginibacter sp.]|nr:TonB-dependent receptor [Ferruginibacter sp.]
MRKTICMLLILLTTLLGVKAQDIKVTGTVTESATGKPLESASVTIKGKGKGVPTNVNGVFSITVPKGETLVVSSIGYNGKEVNADNAVVNVSLDKSDNNLADVVVVGYGTQKRANLSGSVVQLNNASLIKRQVSSATQVLQGLAPGVTVQQQSGKPGADGASIRIRGEGSILGNSNPLIVIDGLQMPTGTGQDALNNIDPNVIESVTVLKDAASTAIYGNRASAGVILVKTKRANSKGLQVSYNNFFSKQSFTALPKRVGAIEHMELSNIAYLNQFPTGTALPFTIAQIDKYKSTPANNFDVINTDWENELLTNSGLMQNHNVQLMSGGERLNIFSSFTFFDQKGLIQNNSFKKYDIRFNPEFKLSDKLTLSGVLGLTNNTTINPSTGSAEFIIRQAIGLPAIGGGRYGDGMFGTAAQSNNRNPIAMAEATGTSNTSGNTLLTRMALNYKPVKGLELEASWGREKRNPYTKTFQKNADIYTPNLTTGKYDKTSVWPGVTRLNETWRNDVYQVFSGQAIYAFKVKSDHSFKILAGAQQELTTQYFFGASREGFINPTQPYLNLGSSNIQNNAGANELALVGFFGRLNYGFRDKYLFELNARRDGSSRFSQAKDKQWGNFGSASVAWVFSKEKFFNDISKYISFGKLRGSFGGNGNQNIGSNYVFDAFYQQSNYGAIGNINGTNPYFNNLNTLGVAILQFANPDLSWETSQQWNVGLDLSFAKHFTFTADVYNRTVKNMILPRSLPSSAGGLNDPFVNAGSMENKGWELSLNYKTKVNKWGFDATFMLSDVKNNVIGLVDGLPFIGGGSSRTQSGYALNSYYGLKASGYYADSNDIKASPTLYGAGWSTNPAIGPKPGDLKYQDISGVDGKPDGKIDDNDRTFIGNNFPRFEYSINLNVSYQNFDLNIFGQGVGKRENFLSGTGAVPFLATDFIPSLLDIHKNYWTPQNQNATFPRLLAGGGSYTNNFRASDWYIRSAAFFRLKNINLGYKLPANVVSKAKLAAVRVFISTQNLFTITKAFDGFDPEIDNANGEFYPVMRTYTAGLNVTF